jgi:GWxTD domain-containing protein
VGRVPAEALATGACPQARSSGGAASGFASADRLIAWNYLCPRELGAAFEASFEPVGQRGHADLSVMMASFVAALEAAPGHVGANVEALLTLAEQERWLEVLDGSRRFVQASEGHPYGLLLEGMALQSLSRAEDAEEQFRRALDALPTHEARQLTDVTALLPVEEAAAHRGLSDEDRASLATDFWRPLDPILSTPVNERRVEHLARATYAYLRFGDTGSDAGQVWVRYGRPARVRVVSEGGGLRTEFWDYGPGPDVTFRRVAADDDLALTAEGRTYLDELRSVFPHGYRSGSRPVSTLAGQVGHFRGDPERRTSLVLIHSQAPDLGPGTGLDTLDLGVFLRTTGGEARTVDRRRVPALAPLTLQVPVGPGVESVVVEVFDARTGRAAALHHEIGRIQGAAGPGLSDLMLVQTSSPRRSDVSLDASWIRPYTLEDPVETHALGMLFELYGGIGELVRYRLRAEAEHRGSGTTHALRIQPAGEERYRFSVERRPTSRRTVEFVNVWVGDLPPGTYALRIWADLNGASVPLATERLLEVR